jgi:cardiolipin synthase A/B
MDEIVSMAWRWWLVLWPHVLATSILAINVAASAHAILVKRDTRSTIGWVGLIWLSPVFGAIAYAVLGVNRIRSRAGQLRAGQLAVTHELQAAVPSRQRLDAAIGPDHAPLRSLATLVGEVTGRPLVDGNQIEPLINGDEAYPRMLAAIDAATRSIGMASYIFDNDPTGRLFAAALARAAKRGVEVRVLVDGIGSRYTWPSIIGVLAEQGVRVERFLPTTVPIYFPTPTSAIIARSSSSMVRSALPAASTSATAAGLPISPDIPVRDMHFELRGPVVTQLLEVFAEDWAFAADEVLVGDGATPEANAVWSTSTTFAGGMLARGIRYGPDDPDIGRIKLVLVGALAAAQKSVRIMTPYFLPDDAVCQALDVAAMRGVTVDIVLPDENNLALVSWASTALLWQVLGRGCNVWMSPPPFDHTKLMVVDGAWALFGSGNWDDRSMRLNFEFNVETYDRELAESLDRQITAVIAQSRRKTLAEVDGRSLPIRLRDGIARLFSPYL